MTRKKLRITVIAMTEEDVRAWFSAAAGRKVTATEIADHLGVARNTANKRISDGLSPGDIITVSRALSVNPVEALTDLGHLTLAEVADFVDADGKLLATADEQEIVLELADRMIDTAQLAQLLSRRVTDDRHPDDADSYALAARHGEKGVPDYIAPGEEPQVHPDDD